MADARLAVLGAGSYVFGPSVMIQAFLDHRLGNIELALFDPDRQMVELMAGVGRRMAAASGCRALITAHTDRAAALAGADFVICSAARELRRRYALDCQAVARFAPGHLVTEFGGVAGISYSLRQIALIQEIAADIRRLCPKASLLNVANPLPRVCQAAQQAGVETVGFCSASSGVLGLLSRLLCDQPEPFPWTRARQTFDFTLAGVNHFCWLLELRDRASGRDLLPELRDRLAQAAPAGMERCVQFLRDAGFLLTPCDEHCRDFLPPLGPAAPPHETSHGSNDERRRRVELLAAIASGDAGWEPLLPSQSWERPLDLVAARVLGRPASFPSINLPNAGQIPQLPRGLVVETPASADASGLRPQQVNLPPAVLPWTLRAAQVTDAIVRAATTRSLDALRQALDLDPTVTDKPAGWAALQECLKLHADVLPRYG